VSSEGEWLKGFAVAVTGKSLLFQFWSKETLPGGGRNVGGEEL
jgi:hypothetical protein